MDSIGETFLIAPDERSAAALRQALSTRYKAASGGIHVEVGPSSAQAVEAARSRHGGAPLGVVTSDEASALEALRHGADEAMAWPPHNEQAIQGFFDRILLRAAIRQEQEVVRAAVVHSEKLAALGTLVAGVAHEINNPLTTLQLSIDGCRALLSPAASVAAEVRAMVARGCGASPEEVARLDAVARTGAPVWEGTELTEQMIVASQAIAEIVRDLRIFARSDDRGEGRQIIQVGDLIDQTLRLVAREFETDALVERDYEPNLPKVVVAPGRLTQVLINVLVNAAQAVREVARPAHRVRVSHPLR